MPDAVSAQVRCELVAHEAVRIRRGVLSDHHGELPYEDLEDAFAEAVLELVRRAKRDPAFGEPAHIRNALRQKFASRVLDRRRQRAGRSPIERAYALATPIDAALSVSSTSDPAAAVVTGEQLRLICASLGELTDDQRAVLQSQLNDEPPTVACARLGWSPEKYRKVAQRARQRLKRLAA